jgi:hypothetical protein
VVLQIAQSDHQTHIVPARSTDVPKQESSSVARLLRKSDAPLEFSEARVGVEAVQTRVRG